MSPEGLTHVLFLERSPAVQERARTALEKIGGISVTFCRSGSEAVLQAKAVQPDIILLDAELPGTESFAALAQLKQCGTTRDIPAVLFTGETEPLEILRYRQTGALAVLRKPFDSFRLADQLRCIWEEHLASIGRRERLDSYK